LQSQNTGMIIFFEWERDSAGYELRPEVPAPPPSPGETLLSQAAASKPMLVVGRGGQGIHYKPLEADKLCTRFASVRTPEDVLGFIQKFGPLTEAGLDPKRGDDVVLLLEHAAAMRSFLSHSEESERGLALQVGAEGQLFGRLNLMLAKDPASGRLCLQIRPPSLLAGLWAQLGQKLAGSRPFRECRYCGAWFEAGPGAGRRLDATFCTDEHRMFFNSRKRSKRSDHP
jgi:hypothetical protein